MPPNTSQELKQVLVDNEDTIKGEYITWRLFFDSAIRDKLRHMQIQAGVDDILPHLEKLEKGRLNHLDRMSVAQTKLRHKRRINRIVKDLDELNV